MRPQQKRKDLAWMPATNDVNEGAFMFLCDGSHSYICCNTMLMQCFITITLKAFMEKNFQADDYKFVHQMASQGRGEEEKRRKWSSMLKQELPNRPDAC